MGSKRYMVVERFPTSTLTRKVVYVGEFINNEEIHNHIPHNPEDLYCVYQKTSFEFAEYGHLTITQEGFKLIGDFYFEQPNFSNPGGTIMGFRLDECILKLLNEANEEFKPDERRKGFHDGYDGKPCRPTSPIYREGYNHGKEMAELVEKNKG